jgi:hypothetical protein
MSEGVARGLGRERVGRQPAAFGSPALLKNPLIRRFLAAYAEQEWDHVVKVWRGRGRGSGERAREGRTDAVRQLVQVLVLLGILTAQQAAHSAGGGVRALRVEELEALVTQGARGSALATELPALVSSARDLAQRVDVAVKEALGDAEREERRGGGEEGKREEAPKVSARSGRAAGREALADDLVTTRYLNVASSGYGQRRNASSRGTARTSASTPVSGSRRSSHADAAEPPPPTPSEVAVEKVEKVVEKVVEKEVGSVVLPGRDAAVEAARNAARQEGELWRAYRSIQSGEAVKTAGKAEEGGAAAAGKAEDGLPPRAQSAERLGLRSGESGEGERPRGAGKKVRAKSQERESGRARSAETSKGRRPGLEETQLHKGATLPPYLRRVSSRIRAQVRADRARQHGREQHGGEQHGEEEEDGGEEKVDVEDGGGGDEVKEGRARLENARLLANRLREGIPPADRALPQYEASETRKPRPRGRPQSVAWVVPAPGTAQYSQHAPPPALGANPRFFRPSGLPRLPPAEEEYGGGEEGEDEERDEEREEEERERERARREALEREAAERAFLARAPPADAPPPPVASWEQLAPSLRAWLQEEEGRHRYSALARQAAAGGAGGGGGGYSGASASHVAGPASVPVPRRRSILEVASSLLEPTAVPPVTASLSATDYDLAYAPPSLLPRQGPTRITPVITSSSSSSSAASATSTTRATAAAAVATVATAATNTSTTTTTRTTTTTTQRVQTAAAAHKGGSYVEYEEDAAAVERRRGEEQRGRRLVVTTIPVRTAALAAPSSEGQHAPARPPPSSPTRSPTRAVPIHDVDLDADATAAPAAATEARSAPSTAAPAPSASAPAHSPLARKPSDFVAAMLSSAYTRAAQEVAHDSGVDESEDEDAEEERFEGTVATVESLVGAGSSAAPASADTSARSRAEAERRAGESEAKPTSPTRKPSDLTAVLASELRSETAKGEERRQEEEVEDEEEDEEEDDGMKSAPLSPTRQAWVEEEEDGRGRGGLELLPTSDSPPETPAAVQGGGAILAPRLPESPVDDEEDDDAEDGWGAAVAAARGGGRGGDRAVAHAIAAAASPPSLPSSSTEAAPDNRAARGGDARTGAPAAVVEATTTTTARTTRTVDRLVSVLQQLESADDSTSGTDADDTNHTGPDPYYDARGTDDSVTNDYDFEDDEDDDHNAHGLGHGDEEGEEEDGGQGGEGGDEEEDDDDDEDEDDGDITERVRRLRESLQARGDSGFVQQILSVLNGVDEEDDDLT